MGLEMNIKFKGHDSGNARVYGTHNRKLYCIAEGYDNYGFMGLYACSKDGEPSHQLPLRPYTFAGIDKEVIEKITIRSPEGWGDKQLMNMLKLEHGTWNY